jgi:acyl-CoA reductase-like NAD-dependent aldehyde dehydrogenase
LIRQYQSEIAANISLEQGKTHADAKGDVFRGLQVVDTACAIPSLLKGESVEVAKDMDTTSIREPLGVTGAICPFNFPAMSQSPLVFLARSRTDIQSHYGPFPPPSRPAILSYSSLRNARPAPQ